MPQQQSWHFNPGKNLAPKPAARKRGRRSESLHLLHLKVSSADNSTGASAQKQRSRRGFAASSGVSKTNMKLSRKAKPVFFPSSNAHSIPLPSNLSQWLSSQHPKHSAHPVHWAPSQLLTQTHGGDHSQAEHQAASQAAGPESAVSYPVI